MELLKLTVYKRNNAILNEERAIDVDTIVSPVRFDSDTSKSYFTVKTINPINGLPGELINYQVDEDLAAIKALSNRYVLLTVTSRDGRALYSGSVLVASEEMLFNVDKVAEGFYPSGAGATFLYCEDVSTPVSYIVDEDVDDIVSQTIGLPGTGTVTSFTAGDAENLFTTDVANMASTPILSFTIADQDANKFYSGPATGAADTPDWRNIVAADISSSVFNTLLGTQANENFAAQTDDTTLAHTPKANRHIIVFVDSGSGYAAMKAGTDYTISGAVITWTPALSGSDVMVFYTY